MLVYLCLYLAICVYVDMICIISLLILAVDMLNKLLKHSLEHFHLALF